MKKVLNKIIILLGVVLLSSMTNAQTGKISGRVVDAKTKEGLPFVNVIVMGTNLGAATDVDGYYSIIGVSPGTYTLKGSAIGYGTVNYDNVKVSIDLTTKINFELSETSVQTAAVTIVAKRPLITKDLTSTTAVVDANEIESLPVTEFQEVLNLKAGMVGGSVRGGRSGEVVYAIDGVPVTDVYDGSTVVDINTNSIQELQFVSGAFNAEYGRALSGYVNIATKDGTNNLHGSITGYLGQYLTSHSDIFPSDNNLDPAHIRNIEATLSGSIIKDKLLFNVTGRWIYFGGWINGRNVFTPYNITVNHGSSVPLQDRYTIISNPAIGAGNNSVVPLNWNEKKYGQAKLTYKLFQDVKLDYNFIIDNVDYQDYNQFYTYDPLGNPTKYRTGITNILGYTQTLGANTFYKLNLIYFTKDFKQYVYDLVSPDKLYPNQDLAGLTPTENPSFGTGGADMNYFSRSTNTMGLKFDFTTQFNKANLIKFGVELNRHSLDYKNINYIMESGLQNPQASGNPYAHYFIANPNDPTENLKIDIYNRKPLELSGYIQDKIELNELIINVGIRVDYFNPDGFVLNDPSDPDIYSPVKPEHIAMTMAERRAIWYSDAPSSIQYSPRLGVAFPLTDKGVVHFSYGHFFQIPNFEYLYVNPEYKFGGGTGNIGIAGNPALRPERTISGEVGFQQALTDNLSVDVTGYFRDIRDLVGTRVDAIPIFGGSASYSQYKNSDFGFVKGIVVTLTKRMSDNWSATLDYTLQLAKGDASDPNAIRNQIISGERPELQLIRLNFDQTHTVNATFTYASNDKWGFSLIAQYGSGFPYTPNQSLDVSTLLTNSELKPSTFNVDLKAYKEFSIGGIRLSLFGRVYNLFDIRNQDNVYNDSGTADFTIAEFLQRNSGNQYNLVNTLTQYYRNPSYYSEPRRIEIGSTIYF